MSTKLKGPDGATNVQVDGTDYEVGEDGLFEVGNGDHVTTLCEMGFLTEEQTCGVCAELQARFPRVVYGMVQSGVNISTVHTAEGLLDIIESKLPMTPEQEEAEAGTIVTPAPEGEGEQTDQQEGEQTDGEQGGEGDEGAGEAGDAGEGAPAADDAAEGGEPAADAPAGEDAGADAPVTDEAAPAGDGAADAPVEDAPAATEEAPAAEDPLAEVPKDDIGNPTFNKMNRAGIHAWLLAHGGTELKPDSAKDDLITEAEERADALTKKD